MNKTACRVASTCIGAGNAPWSAVLGLTNRCEWEELALIEFNNYRDAAHTVRRLTQAPGTVTRRVSQVIPGTYPGRTFAPHSSRYACFHAPKEKPRSDELRGFG